VLGDSDAAAEYGIDMTGFEDDGYVLRTVGDSTLIFGKTEDGLDRAVRAYVKAVGADTDDSLDVVYHEGYRIERLTIAGRDISEYTLYYPETANENMIFAASEFVRLVEKATGVTVPVVVGAPVSPAIELRHTDDPALETDGYRYKVTESGLVIEGAVDRGCMNGVWRFLQCELGWDCLIFGESYLNEADHIYISAGTIRSETPTFEFFQVFGLATRYTNDRYSPNSAQSSYGPISIASHGITQWYPVGSGDPQPCYTDEEFYEHTLYTISEYTAANYVNPSFREISIGQTDNATFCICENCLDVFAEEGGHAGAVIRYANRISEEINAEFPGIYFKVFAYQGTNEPPKVTVPNEYVCITFCYDRNCSNHKVDGSECTDIIEMNQRNNSHYAKWLEGWCAISPNVYLWTYTLSTGLKSYTVIDNIYDDFRYFAEMGVCGIYYEADDYGSFNIKRVEQQLAAEMNWNPNMTREEFDSLYNTILEKEYGDGWEYIAEYVDQWNLAQDLAGCWHCWEWRYDWFAAEKRYNIGFYKERFDYFINLMELARREVCSSAQETMLERLYASVLYNGCYSSYYYAYLEGDTERMTVLAERYDRCIEIARACYDDLEAFPIIGSSHNLSTTYSPTIEEAAWKDWVDWYDDITGRPLPDDAPVIEK